MSDPRRPTLMAVLSAAVTLAFVSSPLLVPDFGGFRPEQFPVPQIDPPVQPAGYAFAIWGLIYLWLLVGSVYGLLARRRAPDWEAMRPTYALSVGVGAAWLPVANVSAPAAVVLIWIMLGFALAALRRTPVLDRWTARAPISVYAGWLTAASPVALGLVLSGYGVVSAQAGAALALVIVLALGIWVLRRRTTDWLYGAPIVWALIGIVVSNWAQNGLIVAASIAAIVVMLVALFFKLSEPGARL
ncbi:MAG: hypothetical protein CML02_19635 [Pseudooceanicola sp.]|jgi:hypothetical protein|nr:hypothetical protein [Pseudooceanicola sp.]